MVWLQYHTDFYDSQRARYYCYLIISFWQKKKWDLTSPKAQIGFKGHMLLNFIIEEGSEMVDHVFRCWSLLSGLLMCMSQTCVWMCMVGREEHAMHKLSSAVLQRVLFSCKHLLLAWWQAAFSSKFVLDGHSTHAASFT